MEAFLPAESIRVGTAVSGFLASPRRPGIQGAASQFGEADFNGILSKIGIGGGADGILGKVGGMLDRDGDGNPINDIAGFAKGLFGKS